MTGKGRGDISRNDIGRQLILDLPDPIFQKKLAALESADLELIRLTNRFKRFDSITDVFVFNTELLQFGAKLIFVELRGRR